MKQQDPLFKLFRKHQHKLNEQPSPDVWKQLESKLDQNKKAKRSPNIYRLFFAIAASFALIFFISNLSETVSTKAYQKATIIPENNPIETVSVRQLTMEQLFREKYQNKLLNTIEEGSPSRLLVANKAIRPFLIPRKS